MTNEDRLKALLEQYKADLDTAYECGKHSKSDNKGEWIHSFYSEHGHEVYKCSKCGRFLEFEQGQHTLEDFPFCHCGADMRPAPYKKGDKED